ncbi:haloalkane dehalogenase [Piscinibacter sakaiensis]|uniref:haloalkane dehalogenase n=1 Tax=Piscinibacter sakaiensis TaxID=1547922 RepID=UPI003AAE5E54
MSSDTDAVLPGVLRTPEQRFADLPGFDCEPHYRSDLPGFEGLRVHWIDEGPADAEVTVLCLHGQPTWSYLYRKMLPVFVAAGQRVVAPDLFGFGRSDKPEDEAFYTFSRHRAMLVAFVEALALKNVTLVVQDWGGLLGLTLPLAVPGVIRRLIVMNTAFGTGDIPLGKGFLEWRDYANSRPDLDIAALMTRSINEITPAEAEAYAAPFPDARYKAGVRRFPNLVPDHPDADGAELSRRARDWWSTEWDGASFMAVGMLDPVLGPAPMRMLRKYIRGCPEAFELPDTGHFVQESGEAVALEALAHFDREEA